MIPYKYFIELLNRKDQVKQKDKFHSFLIFQSGAIIQSGSGPDMPMVYERFMQTLLGNREKFEECIDQGEINKHDFMKLIGLDSSIFK